MIPCLVRSSPPSRPIVPTPRAGTASRRPGFPVLLSVLTVLTVLALPGLPSFHGLAGQVPTPLEHFGHEIGAEGELANWDELTAYYERVAGRAPGSPWTPWGSPPWGTPS
jgi:hypothetical protein